MLPTRTTADLLTGMWTLLRDQVGAVPRRLLWDNEAGIGRGGRLAHGVGEFCGTLATRLVQCRPYDPESKGVVERANQYLETSFLPGRTFTCPDDFNAQLTGWLPRANTRTVRALRARPVDLLSRDTAAMLPLPPVAPVVGWSWQGRLGRDYYVRLSGNDYSVDPTVIGQLVDVTADLHRVQVRAGGRLVADHARVWATTMTITDPTHLATAARLRQQLLASRAAPGEPDALVRDLADYDRAFGIDTVDGQVA
jgi:transposase